MGRSTGDGTHPDCGGDEVEDAFEGHLEAHKINTMIVHKVSVQNFRSIENEILFCSELTALVGRNGSGKSSFLRALELFYSLSPKVDSEDFYNRDITREIVISVTYKSLNGEALSLFEKYVENNELTVERVFSLKDGKFSSSYHGSSLQNDKCSEVREALLLTDSGKTAKEKYAQLKAGPEFSSLVHATTKAAISESLKNWERANPAKCSRSRDDGQFFGFKSVASGYLGRFTKFLFIPAIRDASQDAADGASSPIAELMNLVVRSVLAGKTELADLKRTTQTQFGELMDPSKLSELSVLAGGMTHTLQSFVPDASIEMSWQKLPDIDFPLPKADTKLNQDGYASSVGRAGHGLQRAFILTALQHLALAQQKDGAAEGVSSAVLPVLILAIEEPELYQHPNSQHHLARIILEIAKGKTPGVAEKTQVIYGTHSPYFVGIDRIDQIRLLRKQKSVVDSNPRVTKVIQTDLDRVARKVWEVNGSNGLAFTPLTLLPRLASIMTPSLNEGFFADVVVLVEGEGDVAAICGASGVLGYDLASMGVSVIACNGKNSIDRPAVIFSELGISTFIVWDSDKGQSDSKKIAQSAKDNQTMGRLVGAVLEDFPATQVADRYACFEVKLEETLREEIGGNFEKYLKEIQDKLGIPKRDWAMKMPTVYSEVLRIAKANGEGSVTLETIVKNIVALK